MLKQGACPSCCRSGVVTWYPVKTPLDDWTVRAGPFKLEVAWIKVVKMEPTGPPKK